MYDEKTLRQSTNPNVQATLLLIDEIRQLKEILGKNSNLVFLNSEVRETEVKQASVTTRKPRTNATQSHSGSKSGRKKVEK